MANNLEDVKNSEAVLGSKKLRKEGESSEKKNLQRASIYHPYLALGFVTKDLPCFIQPRGQTFVFICSIGRSFHIYDWSRINLLFIGPQFNSHITAIVAKNDNQFVACGSTMVMCHRAKEIFRWAIPSNASIFSLVVFGDHLLCLSDDNVIRVWDIRAREWHSEFTFDNSFVASAMLHPSTYVNKLLVTSSQGTSQLWNIHKNKLLYTFPSLGSPITCVVQAPVVDVVAFGLLNGKIHIHNIKSDESMLTFQQEGKVTSISFRTDENHMMATSNTSGDIAIWNLDKRRLQHMLKGAHEGNIPSVDFLQGQPILVSCGADNSLKQWIFDRNDGTPRLLKFRSGHHQPPTMIRFHGEDGKRILSSAADRSLRSFSTIRHEQNFEFSQGSLEKKSNKLNISMDELKLPQIVQFASSILKENEWDNVLTCHVDESLARTWSYQRKAKGKHVLKATDKSKIKSVCISHCGNYGFIGTSSGRVEMFNMQSGIHRKEFIGHTKVITGIEVDQVNKNVITASLDMTLRIWDFHTGKQLSFLDMGSPVSKITMHSGNSLVAVVCDDDIIRVVDIETKRIVRKFQGHSGPITDLGFSPDGRWLVTSSLDGTVRTWDLPTGHLIDWFRVDDVVTSLTWSPLGDFLATSHSGNVGIYMWANKAQYTAVPLKAIREDEEEPCIISLPKSDSFESDNEDDSIFDELVHIPKVESSLYDGGEQINSLMTLSSVPKSTWQTLLNLELIKKRNKPIEPPKPPEKAPFFIPTVGGLQPKFDIPVDSDGKGEEGPLGRHISVSDFNSESEFVRLLREGKASGNYDEFFNFIQSMSPSSIDLAIRTLSPLNSCEEMVLFLEALLARLEKRIQFELVQTYLNVFYKLHGDIIIENGDIFSSLLERYQVIQEGSWRQLKDRMQYTLCMIDFVRLGFGMGGL